MVARKHVNVVLHVKCLSCSVTLRRAKITQWMADEWNNGRHGGWVRVQKMI